MFAPDKIGVAASALTAINLVHNRCIYRADSRFVPSQWEKALLCNDVSHWLDANLESSLQNYDHEFGNIHSNPQYW